MKIWMAVAVWAAASASQAVLFTDNFNRANTVFNADATVSIGADYELVKRSGNNTVEARIWDNNVQTRSVNAPVDPSNALDIGLLYKGLSLGDTTVSGNSWTVSGQITTHSTATASLQYGLAFNHQSDGSFYAARMNTAENFTALQFVRFNQGGTAGQFASITHTAFTAVSSPYELSITSSAPGVFSYTMTGANITGSLSGTATDTVLELNGGYAGFYMTGPNTTPRFDDLSIEVIPEPATLGLVGFVAMAALGVRRFMLL